jgi:hypothetical protein
VILNYCLDQQNVVFQQDCVPPHWARVFGEFLAMYSPGHWVGRDGSIPWTPRSPDITSLDFLPCGYVKDIVCLTSVTSHDELKLRTVTAIETVTPQMLENTWREIEYGLDILRAKKSAHVEVA